MTQPNDTYETPPEATPSPQETEAARASTARALPLLLGSVFAAFIVVAVLVLLLR
jgi:hypothetical protein